MDPERFPMWLPHISPARVWSYLGGGQDHFAEDRDLAHQMLEADPDLSHQVEASHRWLDEAVAHMGTPGSRQLLDLGTGYPRPVPPTHPPRPPSARRVRRPRPDRHRPRLRPQRIVRGSVADADLTDPRTLIHGPGGLAHLLDLAAPVAVTASLVFQHLDDQQVIEVCTALAGRVSS